MNGNFQNIQSFVDALNQSGVPYLVLRNYENMLSPELYMEGHGDIDLLCTNSRMLAQKIGARSYTNKVKRVCGDGVHYYIMVGGQHVSLDLRSVGDGYYCQKWQIDMLDRRVLKDGFYVMGEQDYLYSLIHHAILQKRTFSDEYRDRLTEMCRKQQIALKDGSVHSFIMLLEAYMKEQDYSYVYPTDTFVPLNTKYISSKLIENNAILAYKHWQFDTKVALIEFLVKVKHLLQGKLQ
jgi:hypothetical protein